MKLTKSKKIDIIFKITLTLYLWSTAYVYMKLMSTNPDAESQRANVITAISIVCAVFGGISLYIVKRILIKTFKDEE